MPASVRLALIFSWLVVASASLPPDPAHSSLYGVLSYIETLAGNQASVQTARPLSVHGRTQSGVRIGPLVSEAVLGVGLAAAAGASAYMMFLLAEWISAIFFAERLESRFGTSCRMLLRRSPLTAAMLLFLLWVLFGATSSSSLFSPLARGFFSEPLCCEKTAGDSQVFLMGTVDVVLEVGRGAFFLAAILAAPILCVALLVELLSLIVERCFPLFVDNDLLSAGRMLAAVFALSLSVFWFADGLSDSIEQALDRAVATAGRLTK